MTISLLTKTCLFLSLASCAATSFAQSPLLLVANQGDSTLAIIDPVANRKLASIPEGVAKMFGHEVAVGPDGNLAYVPLYSDAGVGKPGTDGNQILVIDLATHAIVNRIRFDHGIRPHCIVYDAHSGLLYVTTELNQSISIIDPHTLKVVGSIPTRHEQSHMLTLSHDGRRGYTANVASGTVSVLNLKQRTFLTSIPVSQNIQRIAISPDDSTVVTADQTAPRMALIDTATNRVTASITLPVIGYGSAFTPDGKRLLVTLPSTGQLADVDLKTRQVIHVIDAGPHPQAVLVRPDGKFAYVSCLGSRQVTVVDLSTDKVSATIDSGEKADGMAWVSAH